MKKIALFCAVLGFAALAHVSADGPAATPPVAAQTEVGLVGARH